LDANLGRFRAKPSKVNKTPLSGCFLYQKKVFFSMWYILKKNVWILSFSASPRTFKRYAFFCLANGGYSANQFLEITHIIEFNQQGGKINY
jgi:hypothetical protein